MGLQTATRQDSTSLREIIDSDISARLDALDAAAQQSEERSDAFNIALKRSEASFASSLDECKRGCLDNVRHIDAELRGWIDSNVMPRVAGLEGALRPRSVKEPMVVPVQIGGATPIPPG